MHHLIIGASSAIAQSLINQLLLRGDSVIAVSRSPQLQQNTNLSEANLSAENLSAINTNDLRWIESDYSEKSITLICEQLIAGNYPIQNVFICNGILHSSEFAPEKRLEEISTEKLTQVMSVNTFLPLLWVKHLKPVLKDIPNCTLTAFSARIGSINDNNLGGWYAYRASKAALNMLMKTASIEYQRDKRDVHFLLFHPGTTDTPLSKPFQKSVNPKKLFTPQFVADQLLNIIASVPRDKTISYLDWQNTPIEW